MSRLTTTSMLIGWALAGGSWSAEAGELETEEIIQVCVLDYAGMPAGSLDSARQVAERIYEDAGVRLDWLAAAESEAGRIQCKGPAGDSVLVLRLLPESRAKVLPTYETQFGFALLTADMQHASNAYVFVEKVAEHAGEQLVSWPELLGFVMAHEMGHLLLGTNSHSKQGIMRARWSRVDLDGMARARQRFLGKQKKSIQASVRARIEADRERTVAGESLVASR